MIVEFKPDAVFVIDHLRSEYEDIVPVGLPFLCWIQDYLPKLRCNEAGASVGPRAFRAHVYGHAFCQAIWLSGQADYRPAESRTRSKAADKLAIGWVGFGLYIQLVEDHGTDCR